MIIDAPLKSESNGRLVSMSIICMQLADQHQPKKLKYFENLAESKFYCNLPNVIGIYSLFYNMHTLRFAN